MRCGTSNLTSAVSDTPLGSALYATKILYMIRRSGSEMRGKKKTLLDVLRVWPDEPPSDRELFLIITWIDQTIKMCQAMAASKSKFNDSVTFLLTYRRKFEDMRSERLKKNVLKDLVTKEGGPQV